MPGATGGVTGPTGVGSRSVRRPDDTGGAVASPVTSLPHTPGRDIVIAGNTEESPRTREGRLAAATLEQEMGRRSVAEAIRPIRERAVASSSSAERAITQEMVAEACDTLVRERHPASPPVWPESSGIPAESQPARTGETGVLAEPPLPQQKSASTPRPQRDGSPRETERKPEPAVFSPSPVVGQEQPPPMRTHVTETESSESDASDEPGPKEDPPHLRARRKASQAMAFLLGGRSGEHYGSWSGALRQRPECGLDAPDTTRGGGIWTARMHNSTVRRVLDGLVSARATGHREPEGMNEILRDIPPRRGVLPVPGPARGSPRADGTFLEKGD